MSKQFGDGAQGQILNGTDGKGGSVSDTTPIVSRIVPMVGLQIASFQLIAPGSLAGTWLIEASNDYSTGGMSQPPYTGRWGDIRSTTDPAIPNAPGGSTAQNVFVFTQPLTCRALRVTFTPTGGTGVPEVWAQAESMG